MGPARRRCPPIDRARQRQSAGCGGVGLGGHRDVWGTALPARARRGPPRLRPISAALVLRAGTGLRPAPGPRSIRVAQSSERADDDENSARSGDRIGRAREAGPMWCHHYDGAPRARVRRVCTSVGRSRDGDRATRMLRAARAGRRRCSHGGRGPLKWDAGGGVPVERAQAAQRAPHRDGARGPRDNSQLIGAAEHGRWGGTAVARDPSSRPPSSGPSLRAPPHIEARAPAPRYPPTDPAPGSI